MCLSAENPDCLRQVASDYAKRITRAGGAALPDICFSANVGRSRLVERLAVHGASSYEMAAALDDFASGRSNVSLVSGRGSSAPRGKLAMLFTGQGAQAVGMGRRLYDTEPRFRRAMDDCDAVLRELLPTPLVETIRGDHGAETLHQTAYTQPALFALEWSLACLLEGWGVGPAAVIGHSVGEYVAAALAGVFSWEDGLRLIGTRARLMQSLPAGGAMAVLLANRADAAALISRHGSRLAIAAMNGPRATVISGSGESVAAAVSDAEAQGVPCKALRVSHAFHSPLMDPILDEFEAAAAPWLTHRAWCQSGPPRQGTGA